MRRLIPGKTKVSIELFRGVTIGDVIIGAIALAMIALIFVSNLPGKLWFSIGVFSIAALLLFRMDEQPNYIYVLHILSFFGYNRHFERVVDDKLLEDRFEKGERKAAFDRLFMEGDEEAEEESAADRKKRAREEKAAERAKKKGAKKRGRKAKKTAAAAAPTTPGKPAETEKERKKRRKEEDKLLKSKKVPESEKEAIRQRRNEEGKEAMRRMAEVKDAEVDRLMMEGIIPFTGISDGYIEYLDKSYYGAVLEIDPVEFRFFSEHRRVNSIENCLGRVLRSLHAGYSANIVKIERPINYDRYLEREYEKLEMLRQSYANGVLSEEELKSRVEIEYDRIYELQSYCGKTPVITAFYYLVLFEGDKRQLDNQVRDAQQLLTNGELKVRRLDDKGLAIFLKYTNQLDFDEHDIDKVRPEDYHLWAQPSTVDFNVRTVAVNRILTHNFRVVSYPKAADDAWLASVMSIPGTKVVLKCRPMDRTKSIRNIDHSLQELRAQWSATGVDSKRIEIDMHINTLQELLNTLQTDNEALLECNIYITAYDIVATRNNYALPQPPESLLPTINDMKKTVRRSWQESGFRLNNMEFDQVQAFIGSQVSALDPLAKEGRGIPSNTVAACFPWVFAHVSDEGGIRLGASDGIPVFIDFFRRDSERVNSNMVIVGKSGSGKSYATKSLLANLAAEDAKIFILDPENEYTELAGNLHGQIINVGNAQYGRLNPFHIITALDDDESGEASAGGSYATHLQFLEEFFKQIMPDCEKDAMEYLNTLVDHMYLGHDITPETDLSKLKPEDYPIFDDLYDEVLQEFQSSDNPFTRDLLRSLMNYIAKFSTGGRNANIWNGPSTITTDENFTVFNFQSMLANRNSTIANAQMLLVLKYIDNEIIKNRDYNTKYKANRKIVVVIDEAHVFIDAKFPIALDFMFQLAKRIRKYNGMQIVITQNIKDFVGSEELARKSTAIINACQYSFIFALAPNDMQDLVTLYEKAGGINESEQEQIVQAPRGQAFVVMSPTSRSSFTVETAGSIADMFQEREYQTHYFGNAEGLAGWENFIADIREAHMLNAPTSRANALPAPEEADQTSSRPGVSFRVFDEDEYEAMQDEAGISSGGVSLHFEEDEPGDLDLSDIPDLPEIPEKTPEVPTAPIGLDGAAGMPEAQMAVFSQIANALGRMADAAEGGARNPLAAGLTAAAGTAAGAAAGAVAGAAAAASSEAQPEVTAEGTGEEAGVEDAMYAALERRLREKEEELERLRQEKEEEIRRLREEAAAAAGEEPGFEEEEDLEETGDHPDEYGGASVSAAEEAEEGEDEEEDGELFSLFGFSASGDEDEKAGGEEDEDAEGYGEDSGFGETSEDTYGYGGSEEEGEDEEDDEDEDDDDFMSSFCNFAARLKNMSPFERIRANGQEVAVITLEELSEEIAAQRELRRSQR